MGLNQREMGKEEALKSPAEKKHKQTHLSNKRNQLLELRQIHIMVNIHRLNSLTIDELGSWCLKRLVEPGSNEAQGRRYPWQPCERPPPKAPSH